MKLRIIFNLFFANQFQFLIDVTDSEDDTDFNDSNNDIWSSEDDMLFDKNVTEGIELDCEGRTTEREEDDCTIVGHDEYHEDDDLEYPSSEELLSDISSEDEVGYLFPEFMAETDMRDPKFQLGQLFSSVQECRKAIRTYGAVNGYNVKCKANDERRVQGICKSGCTWRIWASKMNNSETVQVKLYTPQHTCTRDQYNRHCNYIFIVHRYIEQFKAGPEWKTKSMQATIKEDLKSM